MKYSLFSADDHVDLLYLPEDLWTARVPAAYRDRAPHVVNTPQGRRWIEAGAPFGGIQGLRPQSNDPFVLFGKNAVPVQQKEGEWRSTTPEIRLADMDRDGVEGQVLYGPVSSLDIRDPELNNIYMRAYNDWMMEFCQSSPDRLIGQGILPVQDSAAAVAEIQRCAKIGLRGVQFHAFFSYKFVWDAVWEPLWAAAADTGVVVSFHLAGGNWSCGRDVRKGNTFGPTGRGVHATYQATAPNQLDEVLASVILAGILKRHPKLRVVLAEGGMGWIPYILDRMDRKYEEHHQSKRDDAADLDLPPSAYYKRQMYATFEEDRIGIKLLDELGPNTVMWASDYPHPSSTWPVSHEAVDHLLKGVDPKIVKLIVRDSAKHLYGH